MSGSSGTLAEPAERERRSSPALPLVWSFAFFAPLARPFLRRIVSPASLAVSFFPLEHAQRSKARGAPRQRAQRRGATADVISLAPRRKNSSSRHEPSREAQPSDSIASLKNTSGAAAEAGNCDARAPPPPCSLLEPPAGQVGAGEIVGTNVSTGVNELGQTARRGRKERTLVTSPFSPRRGIFRSL